jgi:hypothetical protein
MQIRIAIAIEPDQRRWVAYGASDTPEREVMTTVREIVAGHPLAMWLEVQVPEQQPATISARIVLHSGRYDSETRGAFTAPAGPLARSGRPGTDA